MNDFVLEEKDYYKQSFTNVTQAIVLARDHQIKVVKNAYFSENNHQQTAARPQFTTCKDIIFDFTTPMTGYVVVFG